MRIGIMWNWTNTIGKEQHPLESLGITKQTILILGRVLAEAPTGVGCQTYHWNV